MTQSVPTIAQNLLPVIEDPWISWVPWPTQTPTITAGLRLGVSCWSHHSIRKAAAGGLEDLGATWHTDCRHAHLVSCWCKRAYQVLRPAHPLAVNVSQLPKLTLDGGGACAEVPTGLARAYPIHPRVAAVTMTTSDQFRRCSRRSRSHMRAGLAKAFAPGRHAFV